MLTLDRETQTVRAQDEAGKLLWQAEVLVEDDLGLHRYRRGKAGPWRVELDFSSRAGFDLIGLVVQPHHEAALKRVFLRLPGGMGAVPSLTSSRNKMLALAENPFGDRGVLSLGKGQVVASHFLTVVHRPGGRSLLAGVGELGQDFSSFRADAQVLEVGFAPGRALHAETRYCLALAVGHDPLDLMDQYGRFLSRFARPRTAPVTGWNSWDYYGTSITMDDLRQEMAALNASSLKRHVTHCVLDMGWWTDWGDIQFNRRFPATFRAVAKEIAAAGFVPGIWNAPLQCSSSSHIGRHRQDLLVPSEGGGPVLVYGTPVLDWSKPEVLQLLYDQFREMRKAGFRYFKIDYIYADPVHAMARCADRSVGPLAVIRNGLRAISEAVGDDAYILNCGAARECAVGIADASRVCTDIHTRWSQISSDAREIACHLWENGSLWNIDPDFALVRSPETTDDPFRNPAGFWMSGSEASFSELRVWLTVAYMAGGDLFLSDSVARLNGAGMAALKKLFPRPQKAARPLDLFVSPVPRFWLSGSGTASRLAVFNWDDDPSPVVRPDGIDLPSDGEDVWTGKRVPVSERTVMAPRSAYLLRV